MSQTTDDRGTFITPAVSYSLALRDQAKRLSGKADRFYHLLDAFFLRGQVLEVLENYDFGPIHSVYEILGSYDYHSFKVLCGDPDQPTELYVRKYKKTSTVDDVKFEHALLEHVIANGLKEAPAVYKTRQGRTLVEIKEPQDDKIVVSLFAVYQYLPGEDRYSWVRNNCGDQEFEAFGRLLAAFHQAAYGFKPGPLRRKEPPTVEFMPTLVDELSARAAKELNLRFHEFYLNNLGNIIAHLKHNLLNAEEIKGLPVCPIHGDCHPGNLKFMGDKIVGLYDLDWCKIDLRLFDVCLCLAYSCASWEAKQDGALRLDQCRIFLKAYNQALAGGQSPPPFTDLEKKFFTRVLALANLYIINWETRVFDGGLCEGLNDYEHLAYLSHNTRLMYWIEDHKNILAGLLDEL